MLVNLSNAPLVDCILRYQVSAALHVVNEPTPLLRIPTAADNSRSVSPTVGVLELTVDLWFVMLCRATRTGGRARWRR